MKLHLPVRLFRAVIALMTIVPAFTQAFEVPSTYTTIFVTTTGEVTGKNTTSTDIAFLLQHDLTFSGLTVMDLNAGERIFTSAAPSEISSLMFTSDSDLNVDSDEKLTLAGLNTVTFQSGASEGYASSSSLRDSGCLGGAIFAQGTGSITLLDNVSVDFTNNSSSAADDDSYYCTFSYGGAIYSDSGDISLSGNDSVTFSRNYSYSSSSSSSDAAYSAACGGAIYSSSGDISLSGNGSVSFSGNYSSGSYYDSSSAAYGGAIYSSSGVISLSGNDSVSFSGNYTSSASAYAYAYGGAIYSYSGAITLSENGHVEFIGNSARSNKYTNAAYGGAIYSYGQVRVRDNDSVIFAENYERHG